VYFLIKPDNYCRNLWFLGLQRKRFCPVSHNMFC